MSAYDTAMLRKAPAAKAATNRDITEACHIIETAVLLKPRQPALTHETKACCLVATARWQHAVPMVFGFVLIIGTGFLFYLSSIAEPHCHVA